MRRLDWKKWLGLAAGLWLSGLASAQPIEIASVRLDPATTGDGSPGDQFGIALAASDSRVLVGAYGDVVVAPGAATGIAEGSAYVFGQGSDGNWTQQQKLLPQPFGMDSDNFGAAVAFAGDLIAVAAPRRAITSAPAAGAVFVYLQGSNGFTQVQVLTGSQVVANSRLGTAMALHGDFLAVGAPGAGGGRVEMFRRVGGGVFTFERTFVAPIVEDGALFGNAVALSDSQLLIGAPNASGGGVVYSSSLVNGAWTNPNRLVLSAGPTSDLGQALAIEGDVALVGAPGVGAGTGQVRVLNWSEFGWFEVGGLAMPALAAGARFGESLGLGVERAVVGAVGAFGGEGAAYVYPRNGNALGTGFEIDVVDGGYADRFGSAVAVAPTAILVGANLDTVYANSGQGAVYAFVPGPNDSVLLDSRLDTGDGAYLDRFGTAVSIQGNVAMVGAYLEDTDVGADAGAVHWFEKVNDHWVHRGRITAPDEQIEDHFGIAVDLDGDRVAIGAYWDVVGDNVDQGSVSVFKRVGDTWVEEAKLVAPDGRERDYFGFALALDGDRLLVGARGALAPFVEQGTAYVFRRDPGGWVPEQRLYCPEASSLVYFGASVALNGQRAVIGAPGIQIGLEGESAGAAFVFEQSGSDWQFVSRLQSPQPQAFAGFGFSLAADAQRMVIGAFQDGPGQDASGTAYVYRASDRSLEATLRATNPQSGELMGISVAIAGDEIVLGASGFDLLNARSVGTAHVFERHDQVWNERAQVFPADPGAGDGFGRAVAIGDGLILLGAPAKSGANPLEGTVYVHTGGALFGDGFE